MDCTPMNTIRIPDPTGRRPVGFIVSTPILEAQMRWAARSSFERRSGYFGWLSLGCDFVLLQVIHNRETFPTGFQFRLRWAAGDAPAYVDITVDVISRLREAEKRKELASFQSYEADFTKPQWDSDYERP